MALAAPLSSPLTEAKFDANPPLPYRFDHHETYASTQATITVYGVLLPSCRVLLFISHHARVFVLPGRCS